MQNIVLFTLRDVQVNACILQLFMCLYFHAQQQIRTRQWDVNAVKKNIYIKLPKKISSSVSAKGKVPLHMVSLHPRLIITIGWMLSVKISVSVGALYI